MYRLLRPILFSLEPEKAHSIAAFALKKGLASCPEVKDEKLKTIVSGLNFDNPVGLAAGFDKDCELIDGLSNLGFGFLTLGSITKQPREGNQKPRIVRLPKETAMINAMGLPSVGAKECAGRLKNRKTKTPIILSIAAFEPEDFTSLHEKLEKHADAIEINISSPTFKGTLEDAELIGKTLGKIENEKPLFVKIPPYEDEKGRENVMAIVERCYKRAALVATNTRKVKDNRLSVGHGGLSGKPLLNDTLRIIQEISEHTEGKADIIACGGIFSGKDAFNAITAGAKAVELYTGLIYEGPRIVRNINLELLETMKKLSMSTIEEMRRV